MNSNSTTSALRTRGQQRGAVMIIALILLVVITLLAVSAVQTSNLEVLMATNTQARASALATAENGLVGGELDISGNPDTQGIPLMDWSAEAADGKYTVGDVASVVDNVDWTALDGGGDPIGYELSPANCDPGSSDCHQYALEYLGPFTTAGASLTMGAGATAGDTRFLYRITGRGVFGSGGTRFVQAVFATME